MGRSLPRAIVAAKSVDRAPPFEQPTTRQEHGGKVANSSGSRMSGQGRTGGSVDGVGMERMIAGHPRRAMEELGMRTRLEIVREEIEEVLKIHESMAKGERTSWLKQIERQNEENAYQVLI